MWAWVAGVVLGEHVTGLYGAWLGVPCLWPGWPWRRVTLWLLTGVLMGSGVQQVYQSFPLPEAAFKARNKLAFSDCRRWESSPAGGVAGRDCRLAESPWPQWKGARLDLFCGRCRADRIPDGRFTAEGRLKPRPWWRNEGSYSKPLQWRSRGEQVIVQAYSLHARQTRPMSGLFRPARGLKHEASIHALTLGETAGLARDQWRMLADSGLMHLLVVSGLHVGALLSMWGWGMQRLRRRLGWGERAWRLPLLASSTVLLLVYVWLTGAGVPVVRAALMGLAALVIWVFRIWYRPFDLLWAAMGCVLLLIPGAPWTPGFWLSFVLTAAILLSLHGRIRCRRPGWSEVLRLQIRLTVVSTLLLAALFHQVPVMSLPANLLMIPWMVCVIFPLSVSGVMAALVWPGLSQPLLSLADQAFEVFWWVAGWAAEFGTFWLPLSPAWVGVWIPLVLFSLLRVRLLLLVLLAMLGTLASQAVKRPAVSLTVLDVGQGSAAVVQIGDAFWLIDSGTERAAQKVVVPWLRWYGVKELSVIASHSDNDHAGGMVTVLARWPDAQRWAGQPPDSSWRRCQAGRVYYDQGDIRLDALWPDDRLPPDAPDNAHSCVLRLRVGTWQVLLPGDLPRRWQHALTARIPKSPHTIWVVPHHGAANGLNPRFWRSLDPELALISADQHSPYGHPSPVVTGWLIREGIPVLNTASEGQVRIIWASPDAPPLVRTLNKAVP